MKFKISAFFFLATTLLMMSLIPFYTFCQSWESYEIGESGCSAYFPYAPEWELSLAEDSSALWVGEVTEGDIHYGVICVEFYEPFYDAVEDDLLYVAEDYLDYLRGEFNVVSHTGYFSAILV